MRNILKKLFLAGSGGLIAGALVGMVEASYLLSSGAPEEYVALFYAVVLYGAIGVGGLKMKIHKAAIARLFETNDAILDAAEI